MAVEIGPAFREVCESVPVVALQHVVSSLSKGGGKVIQLMHGVAKEILDRRLSAEAGGLRA